MAKTKMIVALRDLDSVDSLVSLACQVANASEAELLALHVVEVPMVTPISADDEVLDQPGKEILAKAQQIAAQKFSRKIGTRLLRARQAGEAIVGEVEHGGVECLVMGHRRLSLMGEILLGSSVQYVARHSPVRVIVEVPPIKEA
ncbi:MAG: universal stress protein [Terriglobia bacterium]